MIFHPVSLIIVALVAAQASAVVMRHDFYDPTYTDPTKEVRYLNIANQPRFDAVGALENGISNGNQFCSCTLIGPNTVLTAAHCASSISNEQLENHVVTFGSDSEDPPTLKLRIRDKLIHPNYDVDTVGADIALLQVYDASTGGPVTTISPASLYAGSDELTNPNFPVMVGYGKFGYGAMTSGGVPGGVLMDDGKKRGALNKFERFAQTGLTPDDTLVTEFTSPGNLSLQGFPSNFLEGSLADGDSGGGIFHFQGGAWKIAGVNSYLQRKNGSDYYTYNQFPATGGAEAFFVRVSQFSSWISQNLFGAPSSLWPSDPPAPGPSKIQILWDAPFILSTNVALAANDAALSFEYEFLQPSGSFQVRLGDISLGSIDAATSLTGIFSAVVSASTVEALTTSPDGKRYAGLPAALTVNIDGPTGSGLILDNFDYQGLDNGTFDHGLLGWATTGSGTATIVPETLEGDFNNDSVVNAADYVAWRKSNINGPQGYADWRENFGETSTGSGAEFGGTVPEPASLLQLGVGFAGLALTFQRKRRHTTGRPQMTSIVR
jgi:hypothetical protein